MTELAGMDYTQRLQLGRRLATMTPEELQAMSTADLDAAIQILNSTEVGQEKGDIPFDASLGARQNLSNLGSNARYEAGEFWDAATNPGQLISGLKTLGVGGIQELGAGMNTMYPSPMTPERKAFRQTGSDIAEGIRNFAANPGQVAFQKPVSTLLNLQPALGVARHIPKVGRVASALRAPANVVKAGRGLVSGLQRGGTGLTEMGAEALSGLKVSQQRQVMNRAVSSADEAAAIREGLLEGKAVTPRATLGPDDEFITLGRGALPEDQMIQAVIQAKRQVAAEILKLDGKLRRLRSTGGTGSPGFGKAETRLRELQIGAREFDEILPTEGVSATIGSFDDPLVQARLAAEEAAEGVTRARPTGNLANIPDKLVKYGDDANRLERGILERVEAITKAADPKGIGTDLLSLSTGFAGSGVTSASLVGRNIAVQGGRQIGKAVIMGGVALQPEFWPVLALIPFTSPKLVARTILKIADGRRRLNGVLTSDLVKFVRATANSPVLAETLNSGLSVAEALQMNGILPQNETPLPNSIGGDMSFSEPLGRRP